MKPLRFEMNLNEMANFKLMEGIRNFSKDVQSLSDLLSQKLRNDLMPHQNKSSKLFNHLIC